MSTEQLASGHYFISTPGALLNTGLVVGEDRAAVIDTGCGPRQAEQIYSAVREVTELPLVVINTHAHYDHYFGNAYFAAQGAEEFYAHANAIRDMQGVGEKQRLQLSEKTEPEMRRAEGAHTEILIPQAVVHEQPVLVDLGGTSLTLFYLGRGHTDGDVLVGSDHALFVGDVVEEGAPPSFEDSFPTEWVDSLRQLSALRHRYEHLVPGHGKPAGDELVQTMANTMATAIRQATLATQESPQDATKAIPILPYGPVQSRYFLSRLKAH